MKAASPEPIKRIEVPSYWRCDCGHMIGAHRDWCPNCTKHRSEMKKK